MPPETAATTVTLRELADLAIGTPEVGAVNFTALHTLIVAMLKHLSLLGTRVDYQSASESGGLLEPTWSSHSAPHLSPETPPAPKERRRSGSRSQQPALESQVQDLRQQLKAMGSRVQDIASQVQHISSQASELDLPPREWLEEKSRPSQGSERPDRTHRRISKPPKDSEVVPPKAAGLLQDLVDEVRILKEAQDKIQELPALKPQEILQRIEEVEKTVRGRDEFLELVGRKLSLIPGQEEVTMVTWEELEQAITDGWRASQAGSETLMGLPKRRRQPSLTASDLAPGGASAKHPSAEQALGLAGGFGPDQTISASSGAGQPSAIASGEQVRGLPGREQQPRAHEEAGTARSQQPPGSQVRAEAEQRGGREQLSPAHPRRDRDERAAQPGPQRQGYSGLPLSQGQVYLGPDHHGLGAPGMGQPALHPSTGPRGVVPRRVGQLGVLPPSLNDLDSALVGVDQHGVMPPSVDGRDQQGLELPGADQHGIVPFGTYQHHLAFPSTDQRSVAQPGMEEGGMAPLSADQQGLVRPGLDQHGFVAPLTYQHGLVPPGLVPFSADQQGLVRPSLEVSSVIQPGVNQHNLTQPGRDQRGLVQPGAYLPGLVQPGVGQPGLVQPGVGQGSLVQPGVGQRGLVQPGVGQPGLVQPGVGQRGLVQPGAHLPGLVQPGVGQPGLVQPGAYPPALVQPGMYQRGFVQPGAHLPGLVQPGVYQHGLVQPGAYPPSMVQPGAYPPSMVQPGVYPHGSVQPGTDQYGSVQPGVDQYGLVELGADQPGLVEPGADQPGLVEPGADQPGLVEPGVDQPGLVEPGVDQPGLVEPGVDQPGLQPGAYPRGLVQPGAYPRGLVQPGAYPRGLVQPGVYPRGLVQPRMYPRGLVYPGMYPRGLVQPGMYPRGLVQPGTDQHGVVQPGMNELGVVQPGVDQHGLAQPGVDQHGLAQPGVDQHGLAQPGVDQHGLAQPGVDQHGLAQPGADQHGLAQPGGDQQGLAQPGADQHGLAQPGVDQHGLAQPGADQRGLAQPGMYPMYPRGLMHPGMYRPGLVQPGADQHGLMQPRMYPRGLVQPGMDQRGSVQPGADQRGLEQPGTDESGLVQPGADQHELVQPGLDQRGLVQPGADQHELVQPGLDQRGLVQPGADQHGLVQPGTDENGLSQRAAEESGLVQPGTDQHGLVQPGVDQQGLVQPGAGQLGMVQPGVDWHGLGRPSAYPRGLARHGAYPPSVLGQTSTDQHVPVQPGAYPHGFAQPTVDQYGLRQLGPGRQGLVAPGTAVRDFPAIQADFRIVPPYQYQHGVPPLARELHGQVPPLLASQGLAPPGIDQRGLVPPETYWQGLVHPGTDQHGPTPVSTGLESAHPDQGHLAPPGPDRQHQVTAGAALHGHAQAPSDYGGPTYPGYRGPVYSGVDRHRQDPHRIPVSSQPGVPVQTGPGQDGTFLRSRDSLSYLGRASADGARRDSLDKVAPSFPIAVETFRLMGELLALYAELKESLRELDEEQAGQTDLEKIQHLLSQMVKKIVPPDLQEQIKGLKALAKEFRQEKAKLEKIQRMMEGDGEQESGKEVRNGQLSLQLGILRVTVADIEKELAELRESQEQGKAIMENSVSEASYYLQDQLDKLRTIIESMLASSSTLLSMSMPSRKAPVTSAPGQIDPEATCPACSLDLSHQVSLLVQRYEQLQDMVNSLAASRPSKKAKLQSQDEELLGHVQSAILQVQGDCEKLNITTSNLIEDHRQKQKDIEMLYQGLEKLEKEKANREHLEMQIDVKADKSALAAKVSRVQFDATTEQLNRMMQELVAKMSGQEQDWQKMLDKLLLEMDSKLDRLELDPVKQLLEDRWKSLRQQLKERSPLYQADEAAAMRRQLLAHFHCLSCDRPLETPVTGQMIPVTPLGPSLPGHRSIRPYTVFELEQVRQQSRSFKLGSGFPRGDLSQTERSVRRLRSMHSKMLMDIEKVQIHFGGSTKASSQMIRELLQAQCLSSPCYKRMPDVADYTYSTMPRRCGGSHTLTYPYRRNRLQHLSQGLYPAEEVQIAMKHDEVDILGLDGHIYKGRMDTRLPGIITKEGLSSKHKPKLSRPHVHRQQSLSDSSQPPSRPQSAQTLAGSHPVSLRQQDRPVSSQGRLSESNVVPPLSSSDAAALPGLQRRLDVPPGEGLEEPTRGPRSTPAH
nr:glutamine-rich protein 2 isoform X3 [Oryctolagus cuniculus]